MFPKFDDWLTRMLLNVHLIWAFYSDILRCFFFNFNLNTNGPAKSSLEILAKKKEQFEIIFIDADKEGYITYYKVIDESIMSLTLIIQNFILSTNIYSQRLNLANYRKYSGLRWLFFCDQDVDYLEDNLEIVCNNEALVESRGISWKFSHAY